VISSNRSSDPCFMASIVGDGTRLSGVAPSAITRATFHEYLRWSSVVPAVPCTVSVEQPEIAAARCSESQLLPVPGSPTSSSARSEARVTIARSTTLSSPKNLRVIGTFWAFFPEPTVTGSEPTTYRSTIRGDSRHARGRGPSSTAASAASSAA
jgi:hypothetical protein